MRECVSDENEEQRKGNGISRQTNGKHMSSLEVQNAKSLVQDFWILRPCQLPVRDNPHGYGVKLGREDSSGCWENMIQGS
jgi:hypothetical protein